MELDIFSLKTGRKGISPLIATVLVILFGVITLGIALGVVNPAFRRMKDTSIVNDEFHTLETLNTAIKEVASESDGSKRVVPVTITDGTLRVNSTYNWLYFEYEPSEAMDISGEKGDIRIEHGLEFADYFNYYADGSRATPTWTNTSGQWIVSGGVYSGTNGTSYHNISGPFENWKFSASISNVTGPTGGQVFVLPTNPESLVGFWPFDNRSGSVAYDYSGNRNNGTLTNMNTTGNATSGWQAVPACKAGRSCLMFDGVNDYVEVSDLGEEPLTIEFWFYANSINDVTPYDRLMSNIDNTKGASPSFSLAFADGDIKIWGTAWKGFSVGTISVNQWYHLTIVIKSNGDATAYLNGIEKGTVNDNYEFYKIGIGSNFIYSGGASGRIFNGTVDEVLVFNYSFSSEEVTALYELSTKKLIATGTQTVTAKTTPAIVLSNPAGKTSFDDVALSRDRNKLTILIPFTNVELNGTLRVGKGEHKIQIKHMETNTTTSRPIVELTAV